MRLTTVILIASLMQVSASTFGQRITINQDNASIKSVFKEIRKQSGYSFFYDGKIITENQRVSVRVSNVSVEEALNTVLNGLNLTYTIDGKIVSIKKKAESTFFERIADQFQAIEVKGKVVNADGSPLSGASVKVKRTGQIVLTNANGEFSFSNLNENEKLIISYIGFEPQEIAVKSNLGNVVLNASLSKLDEVQIIAYGTTTKRLSTGNIGSIKAEDIAKQPVSNPLLALQGRVSGLSITQQSGMPGASVVVRIQGQNSIGRGNDPFYVIDGVPYVSQLLFNIPGPLGESQGVILPNNQGVGNGSPFNYINPADIESIEVLKDADATAIYGSRAANGAILIKTKSGKTGKTKIDLTMQQGFGQVSRKMPLLNTSDYLEMRKEAYKNDGLVIPNSLSIPNASNYDLTVYDQLKFTDWQHVLLGGTAQNIDGQISISGGNENTKFRINGGYHRETTVFRDESSNLKGSLNFNINHTSTNKKLSVQFTGNYISDLNKIPGIDLTGYALSLPSNAPELYKADGKLNWGLIASGTDSVSTWQNPLAKLLIRYQSRVENIVSNAQVSYRISSRLNFRTSLGFNSLSNKDIQSNPLGAVNPERQLTSTRTAQYGFGDIKSIIIEPQLDYKFDIGHSHFEALVGGSFQKSKSSNLILVGSGYSSDALLEDIKSSATISPNTSTQSIYKYAAIFGRLTYSLSNIYILNLTGRRDGTSRFGIENRLHNFGAIGAAWIFSNTFKDVLPFMSFGKLRASYGTTGSDQIGDYQYMSLLSSPTTVQVPYQGQASLAPNGHSNAFLKWELTKKFQVGLDFGFVSDRILLGAGYFINRSSNQLLSYNLPVLTGFGGVNLNFPATIKNEGWEFNLNTINIAKKNLAWSTSFNITIPKNSVTEFPNLTTSSYAPFLVIGQPIDLSKKFVAAGVDPQTGSYQFIKNNGILTPAPTAQLDNTSYYTAFPEFYGGLQNSFKYKNLSLDVFFQFVKQKGTNYFTGNYPGYFSPDAGIGNQPSWILERWQYVGDMSAIQKFSTGQSLASSYAQSQSTFSISDASFIRLKNVSLSWSLPSNLEKFINLETCRIFIQGQNLVTFTRYKGLDPESRSITNLPSLRVFTFGLQIGI